MPSAEFGAADDGNFYLAASLDRFEYMRIKAELVPEEFKQQYKLYDKIYARVSSTWKSGGDATDFPKVEF